MSKTLRTKSDAIKYLAEMGHLACDRIEHLETELADARAEIERLRQELRDNSTLAARQIVPAEMLVDDLTAEIERKDALIEQMRGALLDALANRHTCTCYDHDVYEQQSCICGAAETYEKIRAALAAERGE